MAAPDSTVMGRSTQGRGAGWIVLDRVREDRMDREGVGGWVSMGRGLNKIRWEGKAGGSGIDYR